LDITELVDRGRRPTSQGLTMAHELNATELRIHAPPVFVLLRPNGECRVDVAAGAGDTRLLREWLAVLIDHQRCDRTARVDDPIAGVAGNVPLDVAVDQECAPTCSESLKHIVAVRPPLMTRHGEHSLPN